MSLKRYEQIIIKVIQLISDSNHQEKSLVDIIETRKCFAME